MWNDDVEISLCRPKKRMDYFFRNGEGDEVVFIHEGTCTLETIFGNVPYKEGDYLVIPRGTTYRFEPEGEQRHLVFESPGQIEIPRRYRNQYGRCSKAPRTTTATSTADRAEHPSRQGEFPVKSAVRGGYQTYVVDYHRSTSSAGTAISTRGRSRCTTSSRSPVASTSRRRRTRLPGPQLRHLLVLSAQARLRPARSADPVPPLELQSEEMIYLRLRQVRLAQGRRRRSITLHPSGLPHGPQPGLAEKSIGTHETHELAVMCDTFHPLKLTKFAKDLDDGKYAYSWYENAQDGSSMADAAVDGDASGAGLTSHF